MLLKKRPMNMKKDEGTDTFKRLWIADDGLLETAFKPGTHYTYRIEKNQVTILPSDEGNVVAKRKMSNGGTKSCIDIRKSEALQAFQGADSLEVSIYDDQIIVKGIKKVLSLFKKREKVIAQAVFNRDELRCAVGENPQLSFFSEGYAAAFDSFVSSSPSHSTLKKDIQPIFDVVSLFSGAGIMDLGFKQQGFELSYAIEFSEDAALTYRKNLGDHVVCKDINLEDLKNIPKALVLIGGSPCQDFSNANRSNSRIIDSPKNQLVFRFLEAVKTVKPLAFLLENVPQILTLGDGKFIKELQSELTDYEITVNKVNSADYGSAQARERAFIIGSKIGKIEMVKPVARAVKTVRDAFAGLTNDMPNQKDFTVPKDATLERITQVPPGGNWQDVPDELRSKGTHSNFYRRLSYGEPSCTIVNVRKSMILHPYENRTLSVREAARLFDIPDDFVFYGSTLGSKQQQVCNGVPVSLSTAAAKMIKAKLEEFFLHNNVVPIGI